MLIAFVFTNRLQPGAGGLMVKRKLVLALLVPSLTFTVMVAVPEARPKAGVTVMDWLGANVPKKMFALGTTLWSDEVAVIFRSTLAVSASLIGNGRAWVG